MEPAYFEDQSATPTIKDHIIELIEFVAIVLAILVVLRFFIAEPHRVDGSSMVPNFHTGDYIITNKLANRFGQYQRGEVIIIHSPLDPSKAFIKRIVGMPGEKIQILNGDIYINDKKLGEPYLPAGLKTPGESYLSEGQEKDIPQDQYFVIGDNRGGSSDSREWGPIKKEGIIGQALLRYWPIQKFTFIKVGSPST